MLTSRSEDKLAEVKEELEALHGGKVAYFPCDITKNEDIQKLVVRTHEVFGKIDILLNNAGGPPSGKFDSFSDEAWQQAFELNLLSYIRIIRAVLPDLAQRGRAHRQYRFDFGEDAVAESGAFQYVPERHRRPEQDACR